MLEEDPQRGTGGQGLEERQRASTSCPEGTGEPVADAVEGEDERLRKAAARSGRRGVGGVMVDKVELKAREPHLRKAPLQPAAAEGRGDRIRRKLRKAVFEGLLETVGAARGHLLGVIIEN